MVVYAVANARSFIYIFICKRHGSIEKIGHLCSHRMTLRVAAAKASKAMAHAMPMHMHMPWQCCEATSTATCRTIMECLFISQ